MDFVFKAKQYIVEKPYIIEVDDVICEHRNLSLMLLLLFGNIATIRRDLYDFDRQRNVFLQI